MESLASKFTFDLASMEVAIKLIASTSSPTVFELEISAFLLQFSWLGWIISFLFLDWCSRLKKRKEDRLEFSLSFSHFSLGCKKEGKGALPLISLNLSLLVGEKKQRTSLVFFFFLSLGWPEEKKQKGINLVNICMLLGMVKNGGKEQDILLSNISFSRLEMKTKHTSFSQSSLLSLLDKWKRQVSQLFSLSAPTWSEERGKWLSVKLNRNKKEWKLFWFGQNLWLVMQWANYPSLDSLVKWAGVSLGSWPVFMFEKGKRASLFFLLLVSRFYVAGEVNGTRFVFLSCFLSVN